MSTEPVTVTSLVTPMAYYFAQGGTPEAASKPPRSIAAYRADRRYFIKWCAECKEKALPASPEIVVVYVAALAGPSDVSRHRRMQEGSS